MAAALLAVLLLFDGCAVGGGDEEEDASALREDLAARPQSVGADDVHAATTAAAPTPTTARVGATTSSSTGAAAGATTTTTSTAPGTPAASFVAKALVTDPAGDPDGQTPPPYGDVVALRLEDNGTQARFTVELAGDVPTRLAAGEQVAVGVDVWRGGTESDYQLYARGNDEGWLAWLDTPSDLVPYPGTFELGDNKLVFTVPWSSLGGRRAGSLSVLVEREQDKAVVLADASADRAPEGRATRSFSL